MKKCLFYVCGSVVTSTSSTVLIWTESERPTTVNTSGAKLTTERTKQPHDEAIYRGNVDGLQEGKLQSYSGPLVQYCNNADGLITLCPL